MSTNNILDIIEINSNPKSIVLKDEIKTYCNIDGGLISLQHICMHNNLTFLDISNNKIDDTLNYLSVCKTLRKLKCNCCGINNLDEISMCVSIVELCCNFNNITSLLQLNNMCLLEILDCSNNSIDSLNGIEKCNKLRILNISVNKINKINKIGKLEFLQELDCSHNLITSLNPLTHCWNLASLNICENNIMHLYGLKNCIKLNNLTCDNNLHVKFDMVIELFNTTLPPIPWRLRRWTKTYRFKKIYLHMDKKALDRNISFLNGDIYFLMKYHTNIFMLTIYFKRHSNVLMKKFFLIFPNKLDNKNCNKVTSVTI